MGSQVWDLPFPLDQLIRTQEVKVVSTVSAEALTATLHYIVDRLQNPVEQFEGANGLKEQNEQLLQRLSDLEARQGVLESELSDLKQAAPSKSGDLEGRLKALEDAAATQAPAEPASQRQDAAVAPPGTDAAALQALQERIAALEDMALQQGSSNSSEPAASAPPHSSSTSPRGVDRGTSDALAGVLADLEGLKQQMQDLDTKQQQQQQEQQDQSTGTGHKPTPPSDDMARTLAYDVMTRLQQLEASAPAADQLLAMMNDIASRLVAMELRAEMSPVGGGGGAGDAKAEEEAAAGHAAVANASSLDDALLIIKELYDKLSNKADRMALEPSIRRTADMTATLGELGVRLSSLERQQQQQQQQLRPTTPPTIATDSATLGRVFDLETSVGTLSNQLQDAASELQAGLQQLGGQVDQLAADLAGKADQAALDRLGVQVVVAAAVGSGNDPNMLTDMLTGIVTDKASKAEVGLLSSQIQSKPSHADLSKVEKTAMEAGATATAAMEKASDAVIASNDATRAVAAVAGVPGAAAAAAVGTAAAVGVSKEEVEGLAQQLGDMFADLAHLRQQVNVQIASHGALPAVSILALAPDISAAPGSPRGAAAAAGLGGAEVLGIQKVLAGLRTDVAALQDALDWVAHASCIMAVGLEPQKVVQASGLPVAPSPTPSSGGKEPRSQKGAFDRLVKLLGRQSVGHKMDWFEPDTLNQMAQKVGMMEMLLQNPQMRGGMSNAPDAGMKDLEAQIRRLSKEMRAFKDKQADSNGITPRMPESDHAMLSGKPLMGYRCMACDRPLEKLHEKPGPYVPNHQMPVRLPTAPDAYMKAAMMRAPVVGQVVSPENSVGKLSKKAANDPSARGPQTWYEGDKGLPAEALPSGDVGPKLPPGGWRGNEGQAGTGWRTSQPGGPSKLAPSALPDVNQRRITASNTPTKPQTPSQEVELQDHALMQMNMLPTL